MTATEAAALYPTFPTAPNGTKIIQPVRSRRHNDEFYTWYPAFNGGINWWRSRSARQTISISAPISRRKVSRTPRDRPESDNDRNVQRRIRGRSALNIDQHARPAEQDPDQVHDTSDPPCRTDRAAGDLATPAPLSSRRTPRRSATGIGRDTGNSTHTIRRPANSCGAGRTTWAA